MLHLCCASEVTRPVLLYISFIIIIIIVVVIIIIIITISPISSYTSDRRRHNVTRYAYLFFCVDF